MNFQKYGKLHLYKWNIFSEFEDLVVCFSTRKGGFSEGPFESLNLGFSTNDIKTNVTKNRERFFSKIDISENRITTVKQVHKDIVIISNKPGNLGEGDGIVTDKTDIFLCGTFADCASIMFFEPERKIVGLFHSGWKGVFKKIAVKGIKKICNSYNIKPFSLLVGISPHIRQCCYIVKSDVANLFDRRFLKKSRKGGWKLDLENAIIQQLINAGIKEENIEKSGSCTSCNKEMFFSYRRDKGNTGRMLAVIGIKK